MEVIKTDIDGVLILEPRIFNDQRGYFFESYNHRAFCEAIAAAGYAPMLYGNQRDLLRLAPELRAAYPVWLAEYDVEVPTAPLDFSIWQYTNAGTVPGIPTDVDLNVWLEPQK